MSSSPNTVLITGGAGFIGSHLARSLIASGSQVRVLDDLSSGSRDNLQGLDIDFHQGDVTCRVTADKACEGVDHVYHLAANASVALSMHAPLECHRVNTLGTLVMHEGQITGELMRDELSEEAVMQLATGNVAVTSG